ncbi:MAG: peptide deformylase [Parcubacteria group bacterium Greene0714_21]|nr:MAG: peptide deformylase [Parcubacteria group bacterium Greene0416_39]TSC98528.1 MAG: peptide deformylase [Parcubacteria group bacterium Greene1014_47]TSD04289.1 MAG: peptide deformylase [Parcubacteria group bacterium Greene0714_21]
MLKIFTYPLPILQSRAQEIERIDEETLSLILQMKQTMDANNGIGLAAPQIGVSKRIIIVKDKKENHAFLNPQILKQSRKKEEDEEGCLSLPGLFMQVKRAKRVEVLALTPEGKEVKIEAEGLTSRIFQHEIDHLNGKLIIHRVSLWTRLLRHFKK